MSFVRMEWAQNAQEGHHIPLLNVDENDDHHDHDHEGEDENDGQHDHDHEDENEE